MKCHLCAEVAGLDEVDDAPEIEQAVFERGAGEGEALLGLELLDALGDLGAGVLDELGLVENQGLEVELLEFLEVPSQQGVVGDDDVEAGDLLAEVVPVGAAFEDEHAHGRGELLGLATPVVEHGRGADDQDGLAICDRGAGGARAARPGSAGSCPRPMSSARMPPSRTLVR